MSIFDIFSTSPAKKVASLKKKVQERYGQPESRQMAMDKLLDMGIPEAIDALMTRFKVAVEPSITDSEEKEYLFKSLVQMGEEKVVPSVKAFLTHSDDAANWAVRLLSELLPEEEVVQICIATLEKIGPDYTRDPEKKLVLIQTLARKNGQQIPATIAPFLKDPADEVRIEAAFALARHQDASSLMPLVQALLDSSDRKRVAANIASALADLSFQIPEDHRDQVAQALPEEFTMSSEGKVAKASGV